MYFPQIPKKHVPFSPSPRPLTTARPLSKVLGICFPTLHKVHKLCFKVLQGKTVESSSRLETFEDHSKIIRRSFEDHSKIIRRSFEDRSKIIQICPLLFCFGFETKISQNPLKILKSSARSWNLTNMTTKPPRSFVPNSDASNSSSSVELVAKLNHAAMLRWKKKTRPLEAAMTGSLSRSWSDRSSWKGAAVVLGVTLNV